MQARLNPNIENVGMRPLREGCKLRKGHQIYVCQLGLVSAALALLVSGCGGGGGAAAGGGRSSLATGVEVMGALTTSRSAPSRTGDLDTPPPPPVGSGNPGSQDPDSPPPPPYSGGDTPGNGTNELNPNYQDRFQVPTAYSVALSKFELLKSENDPNPYVVFNTNSAENPKVINLNSGNPAELGNNPVYPTPGVYGYVRMTMIYTEMTVTADMKDGAGRSQHKIRLYTSNAGKFKAGDILAYHNSQWCWFGNGNGGVYLPSSGNRPAAGSKGSAVVQDLHFSKSTEPYVEVVQLSAPVAVSPSPSGKYVITTNFDVTKSPIVDGSTGLFVWDGVPASNNSDGELDFPPPVPWAQPTSGDDPEAPPAPPFWSVLPPTVTTSATSRS